MKKHSTPAIVEFGRLGSHYGQWNWLMVPCLIAAIVAWLRRDAGCLRVICIMVIACSLAGTAANVVRVAAGRTRPSAPPAVAPGWYGPRANGTWVGFNSNYEAFPSAHTAVSMALVAPLLLMRRRLGFLLLPLPLVIGAARICVNAHHLSDVTSGAFLGFAVAAWFQWEIAPRITRWRIFETNPT